MTELFTDTNDELTEKMNELQELNNDLMNAVKHLKIIREKLSKTRQVVYRPPLAPTTYTLPPLLTPYPHYLSLTPLLTPYPHYLPLTPTIYALLPTINSLPPNPTTPSYLHTPLNLPYIS